MLGCTDFPCFIFHSHISWYKHTPLYWDTYLLKYSFPHWHLKTFLFLEISYMLTDVLTYLNKSWEILMTWNNNKRILYSHTLQQKQPFVMFKNYYWRSFATFKRSCKSRCCCRVEGYSNVFWTSWITFFECCE